MELVRQSGDDLEELLTNEGSDNMVPLKRVLERVEEGCEDMARSNPVYHECGFYVRAVAQIDLELLEGVWIRAYGNERDQKRGCEEVVSTVEDRIGRALFRRVVVDNDEEMFVAGEGTSGFKRILDATATGAIG